MGFGAIVQPATAGAHEGASYSALLDSAKSLAHGDLMTDTSTGFYYKNWKTGGPGVPVPVEFYDDVTGYLSNGPNDNAYIQPSDTLSDLVSRGWVNDSRIEGTVTKTANNPLTLQIPAVRTAFAAAILEFVSSASNHHRYLSIVNVAGYERGTNTAVGTFGLGVMLLSALNNSANTDSVRPITNLSHGSTAGKLNLYMRTNSSVYNAADGPNDAFSSGVIITAIDMNDDQLTRLSIPGSSQLKQSYDESTAAASFAATTDTFLFMAFDNGGTEALDLEITEAHILKI